MTAMTMPGLCGCDRLLSEPHACEYRPALPDEPTAHAAGMVHPHPVPGCPWCPAVECPCGDRCPDPGECYRRWGASETTWRQQADGRRIQGGAALYAGWS